MRVCLITTSQPSTNPRLVKEADALVETGASVHVIGAQWADWAVDADRQLLASRKWTCDILDWREQTNLALFWKSRLRHFAARKLVGVPGLDTALLEPAMSRVGPDLRAAAIRRSADLFIAHNLGALPIAIAAAARTDARVGFDAEDFHSGQLSASGDEVSIRATQQAERLWIPCCDYVTASSPGIADAYRDLCHITRPNVVLNVFPLRHRPRVFRNTSTMAPLTLYWFSQLIGADRGLEDAVRAIGILRKYPIELHLRGIWQPGYEAVLRTLAADLGVHDRIIPHRPAPADDMVRLAAEYDVGLALEPACSVNNDLALSNKLFTYVLAGNVVVATRTKGHLSVATQLGGAVRTYQPGNAEELATHLREWVENRAVLTSARHAAWQMGESRFNWDVEKATFLAAVSPLLASA
jgi:glycosyltransferase involved in cell wall biosynthesis